MSLGKRIVFLTGLFSDFVEEEMFLLSCGRYVPLNTTPEMHTRAVNENRYSF